MAYDVKVSIDLAKPLGVLGFGIPLVLLENADSAVAYTEVSSLTDVKEAGFDATSAVYKAAQLMFAQNHAPKKIAVCAVTGAATTALADKSLVDRDWRQLVVINGGETASTVAAVSAAVEALERKMYFANLAANDNTTLTAASSPRDHTVLFYCTPTDSVPCPVAALVGEAAGQAAGSFTYKNLILNGIDPQNLTDLEITAIHTKGGMTFVTKAGDNVTSEGKTAGGEFIDIIDSEDYIIQQLAYQTQRLLNSSAKVPYDNNGIAMLESIAMNVLQTAYNNGIIGTKDDGSPAYSVSYALREDTKETDRWARKYYGGSFSFMLAGAIHHVEITGEITA